MHEQSSPYKCALGLEPGPPCLALASSGRKNCTRGRGRVAWQARRPGQAINFPVHRCASADQGGWDERSSCFDLTHGARTTGTVRATRAVHCTWCTRGISCLGHGHHDRASSRGRTGGSSVGRASRPLLASTFRDSIRHTPSVPERKTFSLPEKQLPAIIY
jgi:hypothetical protein